MNNVVTVTWDFKTASCDYSLFLLNRKIHFVFRTYLEAKFRNTFCVRLIVGPVLFLSASYSGYRASFSVYSYFSLFLYFSRFFKGTSFPFSQCLIGRLNFGWIP